MDFFSKRTTRPREKNSDSLPWSEKYRPTTLDQIVGQDQVVAAIKSVLEGHSLPHLLFYGAPGTGKTTTILAAARQLFGSEKMKERVLELNASDDRGIQVVRTKIKEFASTTCAAATVNGKKIPGYKIIILDEADSMTPDAQDALRRTLECHTRTTRFCLLCNYVTRIIAPLASRCAKFHFAPLPSTSAAAAVLDVARREHTPLRSDAAAELAAITGGDLRRAITMLQSLSIACCGQKKMKEENDIDVEARTTERDNAMEIEEKNEITVENVRELCGVIPQKITNDFVEAIIDGSAEALRASVRAVVRGGHPADTLLVDVFKVILNGFSANGKSRVFTELEKAKAAELLADADLNLVDGGTEEIQLLGVGSQLLKMLQNESK